MHSSRSAIASFALLIAACSGSVAPRLRPAFDAAAFAEKQERKRFDSPDAAERFEQMKRVGSRTDVDVNSLYRAALQHVQKMPVAGVRTPAALRTAADLSQWEQLGPGNVGGRMRALVFDPIDPEVIYAGGVSGGVWKRDPQGTWWPVGDLLPNLAVNSLAIDPNDRLTIYAGTGEGYFREVVRGTALPLRGGGIFATNDGGTSWQQLSGTTTSDFYWVNDLVVSRHDPERLYAATRTGVWRSVDRGVTWSQVLDPNVTGGCLDLVDRTDTPDDALLVSCGTFEQATVYRNAAAEDSDDWEPVLTEAMMGRTTLAIAPSNQNIVYALSASNEPGPTGATQGFHALFRSDAGGAAGTWTAALRNTHPDRLQQLLLTNVRPAFEQTCAPGSPYLDQYVNMGWYANAIAVDPADPEIVWVGGVDLFRSDNGGRTFTPASYWWSRWSPGYVHADIHGIFFHPWYDGVTQQRMLTATDGGIFETRDARGPLRSGADAVCNAADASIAFRSLAKNLGVTQFYHGAVSPDGRWVIGGTQDNGTIASRFFPLNPDASGWTNVFGGDGGYSAVDPRNPQTIYVEYQWAQLQKTTNGFAFEQKTNGIDEFDFLFITPFILDRNDPDRLWLGGRRLWRSDDGAELWRRASDPFPDPISALEVAPRDSNRMILGTTGGNIFATGAALSSAPGTAWHAVRPREGFVSSVTWDPVRADVAYATFAGFGGEHVWRTKDGGFTWLPISGSGASALPDIPVHSLAVDEFDRRLYIGTDLGIFVSSDDGASWMHVASFPRAVTEWMVIGPSPGRGRALYAFTHGRGAWQHELAPPPPRRRSARRR